MSRVAAIIGGGVIGGGWAARFLLNGWDVRVHEPAPGARARLDAVLAQARRALPMLYDVALPDEGRLSLHDDIAGAVRDADWIQESVPEDLDLKRAVLRRIEAHCPQGAPIGSSTSGFRPSQLQQGAAHPGRILVAHPFNPVYLLPLVELVPAEDAPADTLRAASDILTSLGLHPLHVRKEIDGHIADRLLESVWREALWLIEDGICTTQELDDAIRYGFGLRWAQMGLFETYRIAGGPAGMAHFIAQFGPALHWPWSRLTDVPDLTPDLVARIGAQSDAQSGGMEIGQLERLRDDNLVAILRALKQRGAAAGALVSAHEARLRPAVQAARQMRTVRRVVPVDWTDYNGQMNEGRYGQVFSDAADPVLEAVGADLAYVDSGFSFFTVDTHTRFVAETRAGEAIVVDSEVLEAAGKRLRLLHRMRRADDGTLLAECTQLLIHVSLTTRRACPPADAVRRALEALAPPG